MKRFIVLLIIFAAHCSLSATAQDKIFKEYDIRGIVGEEFAIEDTYEIAAAIATYLLEKDLAFKPLQQVLMADLVSRYKKASEGGLN